MNNNGLRLLSFATFNDLVIGNSLYQHARKHQLTWRNPSGHDSAVLDYVLINSRYRSSLKDVRAMRGPDCGSDHYLLRAVVQLRLQCAKRGKRQPKVDWEQLLKLEGEAGLYTNCTVKFVWLRFTEPVTIREPPQNQHRGRRKYGGRAAFDSVHWPALWKALECEHVPDKIVRLLRRCRVSMELSPVSARQG
ncbi:hypothetical protein COOONC_08007 [Cooperia oncophora]